MTTCFGEGQAANSTEGLQSARGSGSIGGTNSEEASMMNDASTPIGLPAAVNPPGKLAYATPTTAPLVSGRRSFFKYRDLGVTAASSGKIRAQVTSGAEGMTQPTGGHYHVAQGLKRVRGVLRGGGDVMGHRLHRHSQRVAPAALLPRDHRPPARERDEIDRGEIHVHRDP